jgi:hypothetical protein
MCDGPEREAVEELENLASWEWVDREAGGAGSSSGREAPKKK